MSIILKNDDYWWNENYDILSTLSLKQNIYYHHKGFIYIFYIKSKNEWNRHVFDMKNKHLMHNIDKTKRSMIAYYKLNPLPIFMNKYERGNPLLCHMCETYSQNIFTYTKYNITINICTFCKNNHMINNMYVNNNIKTSNTFTGCIDHRLCVAIKI